MSTTNDELCGKRKTRNIVCVEDVGEKLYNIEISVQMGERLATKEDSDG